MNLYLMFDWDEIYEITHPEINYMGIVVLFLSHLYGEREILNSRISE